MVVTDFFSFQPFLLSFALDIAEIVLGTLSFRDTVCCKWWLRGEAPFGGAVLRDLDVHVLKKNRCKAKAVSIGSAEGPSK